MRKSLTIAALVAGSVLVLGTAGAAGAALAEGGQSTVAEPVANPANTPKPAPTKTKIIIKEPPATQAPPTQAPPASSAGRPAGAGAAYAADIANAGIYAPYGWLLQTGNTLCNDWAAGETTAQTDPILLAGGVHSEHLAVFDQITNQDMCPGVTP
jgi:hypothetical protein